MLEGDFLYCTGCPGSMPVWDQTEVLVKEGNDNNRVILETLRVGSKLDVVICEASLVLGGSAKLFPSSSAMRPA